MSIKKEIEIYPLGGKVGKTAYGSIGLLNCPSPKRRDSIISHLGKWVVGKIYEDTSDYFVVLEDKPSNYENCFYCGKKIEEQDHYSYDGSKRLGNVRYERIEYFGEAVCRECEWKFRILPYLSA